MKSHQKSQKQSDKKGFSLLMEWAGRDRWYIYAAITLALVSSISAIVPYFAFYKIMDAVVLGTCSLDFAIFWAAAILIAAAVRVCCNLGASLSSHKGAYHTLFKVRCMVTEHMAKMPLGALNERSTGEIKYVMNESIEKLELFLAHNLPELVLYLTGPIVMFLYLLTVNVPLALVSILPLLLVVIVMILMFRRFFKFMPQVNAASGNLSGSIHEYVNGMRLIKAYNMGSHLPGDGASLCSLCGIAGKWNPLSGAPRRLSLCPWLHYSRSAIAVRLCGDPVSDGHSSFAGIGFQPVLCIKRGGAGKGDSGHPGLWWGKTLPKTA